MSKEVITFRLPEVQLRRRAVARLQESRLQVSAAFYGDKLFMFVRFVVAERDPDSLHDRGIFTALYDLERRGDLLPHELTWFREAEAWLDQHLAPPARLSRSMRPNAAKQAISWLKLSAVDHLRRMRDLAQLLEQKGVPVQELRTDRPGYVVYEDAYQVAAVPFARETF